MNSAIIPRQIIPRQIGPRQISRRQALMGMIGLGGTITGLAVNATGSEHPEHPVAAPDAVSMLYDNTICTGCKACMPACNEAGGSQLEDKKHHQALSGAGWAWLLLR
jgi:ferredoxin